WALGLSRYIHLNPVRIRPLGMGKSERRRSRPGLAPAQSVATVRERMRVLRGYRWSSYRAYLPAKEPVVREGFMHPFGRAALDELKRLGNRKSRGQREQ